MKTVDGKSQYDEPYGRELAELLSKGGPSNIFLVDAPTITDAVSITSRVTFGYGSVDTLRSLNQPDLPRNNHWLVVYLGTAGSAPSRWLLESVTVEEQRIRFNYHRSPSKYATADIHHYYYWAPLGMLDSGTYKLELYETQLKEVTLMRRVEVKIR